MQEIDRMPAEWRALVYEYGFQATCSVRGMSLREAQTALAQWRAYKQLETFSRLLR